VPLVDIYISSSEEGNTSNIWKHLRDWALLAINSSFMKTRLQLESDCFYVTFMTGTKYKTQTLAKLLLHFLVTCIVFVCFGEKSLWCWLIATPFLSHPTNPTFVPKLSPLTSISWFYKWAHGLQFPSTWRMRLLTIQNNVYYQFFNVFSMLSSFSNPIFDFLFQFLDNRCLWQFLYSKESEL
jgi:hypothetical protein